MRKILVFFMIVVTVLGNLTGIKTVDAENICFIGHRGASFLCQENTAESFRKAGEQGFGGVETDVRITKDGVFVLSHGGSIEMADGTEMDIADHTYEELTAQHIKNKKSTTELDICTFKEYLEICKEFGMICFIELKGVWPAEKITEAFTLAGEVYDLSMCELQSFEFENLVAAHEEFPELKIMLTCDTHDALVDKALEYGFDIDMEYSGLTKETVQMFHDKGLKVACWTANLNSVVLYCASLGVDFIESDIYSEALILRLSDGFTSWLDEGPAVDEG
ncbi:MAG: hypothetical protein IK118_07355 [Clostridia bacterium]|nr:hypothetical protein [Clostridia bacterium]